MGAANRAATMIDREGVRNRPDSTPLMHQRWSHLLFLHWRVPVEAIRGTLPAGLQVDTHAGEAWISVTPFTMSGIRPSFLPALPLVSRTRELNVRTYVHHEGVPGVWFFSLDASNPLAVVGARAAFHLPYFPARMRFTESASGIEFRCDRLGTAGAIGLHARWTPGPVYGHAAPGSLEYFLVERYCLYARRGGALYRSRIYHDPWELRGADLHSLRSTMLSGQNLPGGDEAPLVHAQGRSLEVEIWPPKRAGTR